MEAKKALTGGEIFWQPVKQVFGYLGRVARARAEAFICGGGASRRMDVADQKYFGQK
jgi:hypothetical protein